MAYLLVGADHAGSNKKTFTDQLTVLCNHCILTLALGTHFFKQ
jgi:hypothetical protein